MGLGRRWPAAAAPAAYLACSLDVSCMFFGRRMGCSGFLVSCCVSCCVVVACVLGLVVCCFIFVLGLYFVNFPSFFYFFFFICLYFLFVQVRPLQPITEMVGGAFRRPALSSSVWGLRQLYTGTPTPTHHGPGFTCVQVTRLVL